MHFITSCRTAQGTNLTTVASLAIHYEDGNPELVDLEFNKNIGDWDFVMGTPVNIENIASRIIDQRPNNRNDRVTWHLAWKNPHPDRKVSHLDFISGRQNTAPYLIAVTVE
jgi:hypothetical protein